MADADDDVFANTRPGEVALAGQDLTLLTSEESGAIRAYALNFFQLINDALWGHAPMTPVLKRHINLIRSGLAKYPLSESVRVTRESEAALYGIVDETSAYALVEEQFTHRGFLSTCGLVDPPRSMLHRDPVILDLIVPAGTPALRLGELATVPAEREVLLIDARSYFIVGVDWDTARSMWRIQAFVTGGV
ncbi:ADP-ribosyltransferase [Nocardia mexicana]|uniref:ADP-ribosyltransferase n=1 Tax=Nocardia mexicana TaxID=279262 RepID=UPI0008328956|nr:ADP-ribosyltransferase [Nocardia mexicana]